MNGASQSGHIALLLVVEEPRPGPEPATTLLQPTVDYIVRENAVRLKTVILRTVQVNLDFTQFLGIAENCNQDRFNLKVNFRYT